ncbi:MAG: Dabb family protein [Clostridia bacterium]|nr:Dabb family protein [Clostridia bacterium]
MIRHIVFTKFQNPAEHVPHARALLEALPAQIPEIVSLETGCDFLRSERSWDMALVVSFRSREALETYAAHPAHLKVKEYIHAHRCGSATVDYEL